MSASGQDFAPAPSSEAKKRLDASWLTNTEARTMTLKIPAPRGLILDREGRPLANNRVAYYLGLNFPLLEDAEEAEIVSFARAQTELASELLGRSYRFDPVDAFSHYRHRRWVPYYLPGVLSPAEVALIQEAKALNEAPNLLLQPLYLRQYPASGKSAAHVVGYVGKVRPLPKGPIDNGDPMWEETEGRKGLEKTFDEVLRGTDGRLNVLFDQDGKLLVEEILNPPTPGNSVITTLDGEWQAHAQKVLAEKTNRGALVVVDVQTGEVLTLASWPTFDPNVFIPAISTENYALLRDDPAKPLYGRAFQGVYPPASTFKTVVALAALQDGIVEPNTRLPGPPSLRVGNRTFNNWSKDDEGRITVYKAIARSTNTWFYRVGIDTGAESVMGLSQLLGFGQPTGLPLEGESSGFVPTNAWHRQQYGYPILDGDMANLSIGQGSLLVTPVQMARVMAGIGNGRLVPKLQLVKQIQNLDNRVIRPPESLSGQSLNIESSFVEAVRAGMRDVVESSWGTAKSARIYISKMAGKTGTAQWGATAKNQNMAWFAGFLPAERPEYAFAAVYEGRPGEKVSGGGNAGPIAREFFKVIYKQVLQEREGRSEGKSSAELERLVAEADQAAAERKAAEEAAAAPPSTTVASDGQEVRRAMRVLEPTVEKEKEERRSSPLRRRSIFR